MNRFLTQTRVIVAAMVVVALPGATASATGIQSSIKGKEANASFVVKDNLTCSPGVVRVMETFVGIFASEVTIRTKGQLVSTVRTDLFVGSTNPCTFESSFDFGTAFGGTLPMTSLDSATIAGHFVLDGGTVLDANLTLTGTDQIVSGHSMTKQNFGGATVTIRRNGTTRSASLGGTVTLDGRLITASQMVDGDVNMARNTSGSLIVIKSGN